MRAPPTAAAKLPMRQVVFWAAFAVLLALGVALFFRKAGSVAPMLEVLSD